MTIYRDKYGMPHIDGKTDEAVLFGFGYCQAEDYFWQIEDSYVMGLGRYAELYGKPVLPKDIRTRAFEIPQRSKEDFENSIRSYSNWAQPFRRHQPLSRHAPAHEAAPCSNIRALVSAGVCPGGDLGIGRRPLDTSTAATCPVIRPKKLDEEVKAATGSNAWAISGSKTRLGQGHAADQSSPAVLWLRSILRGAYAQW